LGLFVFNGEEIRYEVKKSNRKTIGIKISPEEGVVLSIPLKCSQAAINYVLNKKAAWIISKIKLVKSRSELLKNREYKSGERLKILGDYYNLNIMEGDYHRCTARFDNNGFNVFISEKVTEENRRIIIREALTELYKEIAKRILRERTEDFAKILGVKPNRITIKEQKSIWGSCSSKDNINYNWKIIMAPIAILDYIVVHELCHLREHNHSKNFWDLLESIMPDYKMRKNWLKDNGVTLDIDKVS
jgi:predicted metal-dependent hydrolase